MSSFPTARTSTTDSSTNCPSRSEDRSRVEVTSRHRPIGAVSVICCGAIAAELREITRRRGFDVELHPLSSLLHNRPDKIPAAVEELARGLGRHGRVVAVGYADCGTYGALDEVCERLGLYRLRGRHCYDVFAAARQVDEMFAEVPGTYLLTDFLVRSFHRSVVAELGLDRHPELRDDYFGHYRRVVWLATRPSPELEQAARSAASLLGLPLEIRRVGDSLLEHELELLIDRAAGRADADSSISGMDGRAGARGHSADRVVAGA